MLKIITEPNQLLHQKSREVLPEEITEELSSVLSDMAVTMYARGGVGLSGPQIGDFRRIIVADLEYAETTDRQKYGNKLIKMINPIVTFNSGSVLAQEGCLSVPGFEQVVERGDTIIVEFLNELGESCCKSFENFAARIILHEIDHLDGITLLSKAGKLRRAKYIKKIKDVKQQD